MSFSVTPFSFCLQSLPASGSFPVNWLFTSDGQSFSFSIIPSNEYSWLISFRIDWLDLLAVQGTLQSLLSLALQFKNISSSALSCLYGPTLTTIHHYWKNRSFVGTVMSLLSSMLSRLVIAFLSRNKCLLISWLQSLQWFCSPRKENLSLLPHFTFHFAMKWWDCMPWSCVCVCELLSCVWLFTTPWGVACQSLVHGILQV